MVKFAHLSDCHLGSWAAHLDMREFSVLAFEKALDMAVLDKVDFIVIAGDLFDTALPSFDILRRAVAKLREISEKGIRVYAVPGSHDYSPTGKTFLNVLEDAGFLVNVAKASEEDGKLRLHLTKDPAGASLAGMIGRAGSLEHAYFENILPVEEKGFKIFVFHSAIEEYKPPHLKEMRALPLSLLPKGFDYYAAGHVHAVFQKKEDIGYIAFPGETFPTSFDELEDYHSGYNLVVHEDGKISVQRREVRVCDVHKILIDASKKTITQIEDEIKHQIQNVRGKVVLLRIKGILENGLPSDIGFHEIEKTALGSGAVSLKKNINSLRTKELLEIRVSTEISVEEIEKRLIAEHAGKKVEGIENLEHFTLSLFDMLKDEKEEGETNFVFEERVKQGVSQLLEGVRDEA